MNSPPPRLIRSSRLKLTDPTPTVLRFKDGRNTSGRLQVVSVTGGLLCLHKPVDQGLIAKVMFLTSKGPVLGAAEMLQPVSSTLQPFRFIALDKENHRRLHQTVQSSVGDTPGSNHSVPEEDWIRKYRAAVAAGPKQEKKFLKMLFGAFTVATMLASAVYFRSTHR